MGSTIFSARRRSSSAAMFVLTFVGTLPLSSRALADDAASFGRFGTPGEQNGSTESAESTQTETPWPETHHRREGRFGGASQFAIFSGSTVSVSSSSYSASSARRFGVTIAPSLDYFVKENFSVGLEVDFVHSTSRGYAGGGYLVDSTYTLVGAGIHAGVDWPISRIVSLYPVLSLGVHRVEQQLSLDADPSVSTTVTRTGPWLSFSTPLMFEVAPHLLAGVGPAVYHDFSSVSAGPDAGVRRTVLGGSFLVGGYFGGDDGAKNDPVTASHEQHFGDGGSVMLSEETSLSLTSATYSGPGAAQTSFEIAPGFDWFAIRGLSLGMAGWLSGRSDTTPSPSGAVLTYETDAFGILGRVGVAVPLGASVSLYPRLSMAYGVSSTTLRDQGLVDKATTLTAAISAPVLVHVVPHFFIGIGPQLSTDLSRAVNDGAYQNRGTTFGLQSLIGGWL